MVGNDNGSGFAPAIEFDGVRVFHGDCREVLKSQPDCSVDSIVTDPPYELGFMGKKWDATGIAYDVTVWFECLRVLKPGGHVLAFGGSRTWHRLAVAIEDAGFELRDSIAWLYGSGFPKSMDVSKAIDKALGAEREVVTETVVDIFGEHEERKEKPAFGIGQNGAAFSGHAEGAMARETLPATLEAEKWQGWGTALKPAFEPIVVGRKPLVGTVAENVLEWGVGGLNIDGSRIGTEQTITQPRGKRQGTNLAGGSFGGNAGGYNFSDDFEPRINQGRWPANVILDEHTAELLDQQSGVSVSKVASRGDVNFGNFAGYAENEAIVKDETATIRGHNDSGGASRFFYVAKASKRDRNEGLDRLDEIAAQRTHSGGEDTRGRPLPLNRNFHPTVKPTQLMRYLIKLVTPPGGTVLDPFTGSGSTGKAAILDGFGFVGAELTEEYLPIIEGRLKWALENRESDDTLF